jgi:hypothetical protein
VRGKGYHSHLVSILPHAAGAYRVEDSSPYMPSGRYEFVNTMQIPYVNKKKIILKNAKII